MLIQGRIRLYKSHSIPIHIAITIAIGFILGVISLLLSPRFTLIAVAAVGIAVAILKRHELILIGILFATSSILFEDWLPLIPIGIGSLHIPDLLLLGSFGIILIRLLIEPDFRIIRTPLDWPILAFYSVIVISTVSTIFRSSIEFNLAFRSIRVVTYYLTFFVVTNLIREEHQIRYLMRGLSVLASVIAIVMVSQFLLGDSISLLPGRIEILKTQGIYYEGVTRIVTPGRSLLLVFFIYFSSNLILDKSKNITFFRLVQWGLTGVALILTFLRSYWVVVVLAMVLLAYLVRRQSIQRFFGISLIIVVASSAILLSVFAEPESRIGSVVIATLSRISTLGSNTTLSESSLEQRYIENEYALKQIANHPIIGLGLRAQYRPWDPRIDVRSLQALTPDSRSHIHNGHLLLMVNSGLVGYLIFLSLSFIFLIRGFKHWHLIENTSMRSIVLGFTIAYLGILVAAVVNSTFVNWFWTPVLAIMWGTNEVIYRISIKMEKVENNNSLR
jgi:hypothetical protein